MKKRGLPTASEIKRAAKGEPLALSRPLAQGKALSRGERVLMLETMEQLFAGLYTHLPLKRARYGYDPVQRLRSLRAQVDAMPPDDVFNAELSAIFAGVRDWHTAYKRPRFRGRSAVLPFVIEAYGDAHAPTYIVSKVANWVPKGDGFEPGVFADTWNAVPIDRVVQRHGERESGGRPDSMRAQALTTLTSRALSYFDLPDEERVEIGFRKPGANGNPSGSRLHAAFEWRVVDSTFVEQFTGISATRRKDGGVRLKALNHAAAEAKQAKLLLFAPQALLGKTRAKPAVAPTTPGAIIEELPTKQTGILKACKLAGPDGPYGYLRIYTFDVKRVEVFLKEVRQLLEALPQRGLIVDIRDNPGGVVVAAEALLQYFTPNRIEPARFSVLATDFSRQFCSWGDNVEEFKEWWPSLKEAIRNGEPYSAAIPVTKPELCNDGCQVYSGPVVLVADSATYSSGDLFAAGFVDNEIGTFVCVGDSTGAGGASVENYLDLRTVSFDSSFELPKLPDGAGLLMSVMRATRAGRSLGTQIEDAGVAGNKTYVHSRDDLLHDNRDLLAKCVGLLHQERATRLDCGYRTADRTLEVRTSGLKQLDIKVDDQWLPSRRIDDGKHEILIAPTVKKYIEVLGWSRKRLRQRRVIKVNGA